MARKRANNEGSVFQDQDGTWWAQLPADEQGPPALLAILERCGMSLERFIEVAPVILPILKAE
jgi:hypothetical protein